jgi:hypothetical protein
MLLGSIQLPDDLNWTDEFAWNPVGGKFAYGLDGTAILQVSTVSGGRPVTLSGGEDHSWISRQTLEDLRQLAANPALVHVLTFVDGRTMNVMFRSDEEPVTANHVLFRVSATLPERQQFQYVVTLNMRQV